MNKMRWNLINVRWIISSEDDIFKNVLSHLSWRNNKDSFVFMKVTPTVIFLKWRQMHWLCKTGTVFCSVWLVRAWKRCLIHVCLSNQVYSIFAQKPNACLLCSSFYTRLKSQEYSELQLPNSFNRLKNFNILNLAKKDNRS